MANGLWRNARFRDTQFPLLLYGLISLILLALSRAEINLFDRVRAAMTDWSAPVLHTAQAPANGLHKWSQDLSGLFHLYQENLRLKDENARLRQWQGTAVQLQTRLTRDEQLLRAMPKHQDFLAFAHVIGHSGKPFLGTLILDAGKIGGVRPGQAVMDGRGLIGRIFVSGRNTSWVLLTSDINSRIPVVVGAGSEQAILAGDNADAPILEALRPRAKVKVGDQVMTSGDGGMVPAGIAVGTLIAAQGPPRVELFADPATAEAVEIMRMQRTADALPPSALQDSTMTPGMRPLAPPSVSAMPGSSAQLAVSEKKPTDIPKKPTALTKAPAQSQTAAPSAPSVPQPSDDDTAE